MAQSTPSANRRKVAHAELRLTIGRPALGSPAYWPLLMGPSREMTLIRQGL